VKNALLMAQADNPTAPVFVRFSNRPVGVKHVQAVQHFDVDVARGLVLLLTKNIES
jgi:hypothetical protein